MKMNKLMLAAVALVTLTLHAVEKPWYEMTGEKMQKKNPQLVKKLGSTGTMVIRFDGKTFLSTRKASNIPERFTWTAWICPKKASPMTIIGKSGWHTFLNISKTGTLSFSCFNDEKQVCWFGSPDLKVTPGKWQFVAVAFDGEKLSLYVNSDCCDRPFLREIYSIKSHYGLGAVLPSDKTNRFQGEMNAIRIWNTALTQEEIKNIFESEKSQYSVK